MCGRFVVTDSSSALLAALVTDFEPPRPNYNVAPTTSVTIARTWEGKRTAPAVRWGFVPSWAKDFTKHRPQPINARLETASTSPLFRKAFAVSRAIITAAGYYEWTVTETGKQPHFIHDESAPLAMAGIVSAWSDPAKDEGDPDKWRLSMAIITRDSHVAPGEVHDRMPACLTSDAYDDWLGDHLSVDELLQLLDRESFAVAHDLTHYEVTHDVNSVRNNGPHLIEPLS